MDITLGTPNIPFLVFNFLNSIVAEETRKETSRNCNLPFSVLYLHKYVHIYVYVQIYVYTLTWNRVKLILVERDKSAKIARIWKSRQKSLSPLLKLPEGTHFPSIIIISNTCMYLYLMIINVNLSTRIELKSMRV